MTIDLILNSAILMEDVQKKTDIVKNAMKMNTITTRRIKMNSNRDHKDPEMQQWDQDREEFIAQSFSKEFGGPAHFYKSFAHPNIDSNEKKKEKGKEKSIHAQDHGEKIQWTEEELQVMKERNERLDKQRSEQVNKLWEKIRKEEKESEHYDTVTFSVADDAKKQNEYGAGIKILKAIAKPFVYLYNKFISLLGYSYRNTEHKFEDSSPNRNPIHNFSINHRNPVKVTPEKVQKIEENARELILVSERGKTFF